MVKLLLWIIQDLDNKVFMLDNDIIINTKIHNLFVTNEYIIKKYKKHYKCICDCGKERYAILNKIATGSVKSCGCKNVRSDNKNLKGSVFGKLTVLEFSHTEKGVSYQKVKCECGEEKSIRTKDLKSGRTKSCGCLQITSNLKPGTVFNRLTVLRQVDVKTPGIFSECLCECGNIIITKNTLLEKGFTKSCGCIRKGLKIKDLTGKVFGKLTVLEFSHVNIRSYWKVRCNCGKEFVTRGTYLVEGLLTSCRFKKSTYNKIGNIYGLYDVNGNLRYVGKTIKSLSERLEGHLNKPVSKPVKNWIIQENREIYIKSLMKNVPDRIIDYAEMKAIKFYRKNNDLLNRSYNNDKKITRQIFT